jgi:hypothetical protein
LNHNVQIFGGSAEIHHSATWWITGNKNKNAQNVLVVEYMKHNLLSVSQMCDQGHKVTSDSQKCEIRREGSWKLVGTAARTSNNIYV